MSKKVTLEISNDEALILHDLLCRINDKDDSLEFEDQAEQRVLWNLECVLEKILAEPFDSNYSEILEKARSRVRD